MKRSQDYGIVRQYEKRVPYTVSPIEDIVQWRAAQVAKNIEDLKKRDARFEAFKEGIATGVIKMVSARAFLDSADTYLSYKRLKPIPLYARWWGKFMSMLEVFTKY